MANKARENSLLILDCWIYKVFLFLSLFALGFVVLVGSTFKVRAFSSTSVLTRRSNRLILERANVRENLLKFRVFTSCSVHRPSLMTFNIRMKNKNTSMIASSPTESTALWMEEQSNDESEADVIPEQTPFDSHGDEVENVNDNDKDRTDKEESIEEQIWNLALPAFVGEVVDPLLGLVDTAFVGRFTVGDSSAALAGIGSATALLNFSFFLFNFLTTATTPLVSNRRAANKPKEAMTVAGQALSFALLLGGCMSTFLISMRGPLLSLMGTGETGIEADQFATSFLTIRALAAPAVFTISASTGVLRGYMDTKTPVAVLLSANALNFTLDVIFILVLHLGPTGAALATTSAEWISALTLLGILSGRIPNIINPAERTTQSSKGRDKNYGSIDGYANEAEENDSTCTDFALKEEASYEKETASNTIVPRIVPSLAIPKWEDVKPLIVASGSLFLRSVSLQAFLAGAAAMAARGGLFDDSNTVMSAPSTSVSSSAAASVAAHQVALQLWLLCSFVCDALAAASQVLVADAMGRSDSKRMQYLTKNVTTYSLGLGAVLATALQIGFSTEVLVKLFIPEGSDTAIALVPLVPILVLSQPLNAMVFTFDGVLQGASQFPYQAKTMVLSVACGIGSFLLLNKLGDGTTNNITLVHVWEAFCVLQLARLATSIWKLIEKEGPINLLNR